MAEDGEVKLEIKIRDKKRLMDGIDHLTSNMYKLTEEEHPYRMYTLCKEALKEAAIFFYSSLPEETASKMVGLFLEKASKEELTVSLNALWTGTPQRKTTNYHRMLFVEMVRYIEISGHGELVNGPSQIGEKRPWEEIFQLARDTRRSAPSRTPSSSGAYKS